MKPYRVQHQKAIGSCPVLIMQNRIVEAESAEQALRKAMRAHQGDHFIEVRHDDLAVVDNSSPTTCFDYWKAELELYWKPAKVIGA
jgi:hypothetical protein